MSNIDEYKKLFKSYTKLLAPELELDNWDITTSEVASVSLTDVPQRIKPTINIKAISKCTETEINKIAFEEAMHCCLYILTSKLEGIYDPDYIVRLEHQVIHKLSNCIFSKEFINKTEK